MGFPDLPPPSSTCLKRCRSEDPSYLAELFSPLPKQPFSTHSPFHLSILEDLESSLNSAPAEAPTPEELVMEMMLSLEKVMGDIGELIAASGESQASPVTDSTVSVGEFKTKFLQECDFAVCDHDLPSSTTTPNMLCSPYDRIMQSKDVAAVEDDGPLASDMRKNATAGILPGSLDDDGDIAGSDGNVASVFEPGQGYMKEGDLLQMQARIEPEECARHGRDGLDNIRHLLDLSEDELGVVHDVSGMSAMTLVTEPRHGQWSLLDEFTGEFVATDVTPNANDKLDWLDDGYGLPAFSLSQTEEDVLLSGSTDHAELLLLDRYL